MNNWNPTFFNTHALLWVESITLDMLLDPVSQPILQRYFVALDNRYLNEGYDFTNIFNEIKTHTLSKARQYLTEPTHYQCKVLCLTTADLISDEIDQKDIYPFSDTELSALFLALQKYIPQQALRETAKGDAKPEKIKHAASYALALLFHNLRVHANPKAQQIFLPPLYFKDFLAASVYFMSPRENTFRSSRPPITEHMSLYIREITKITRKEIQNKENLQLLTEHCDNLKKDQSLYREERLKPFEHIEIRTALEKASLEKQVSQSNSAAFFTPTPKFKV